MMVSAVAKYPIHDGKIPSGYIPLIILHWCHEHYQSTFSPLDMRKSFEQKLREGQFAHDVIFAWIDQAESWAFLMEQNQKGSVDRLLGEYFQIYLVA